MLMSFFVFCFVNYDTLVVNHELRLYGMPFLLSRIICLFSCFVLRPWYLLFCAIYEGQKAWKHFLTSSGMRSLFDNLCIFCGIVTHFLINTSIFWISLQTLLWSKSNKILLDRRLMPAVSF